MLSSRDDHHVHRSPNWPEVPQPARPSMSVRPRPALDSVANAPLTLIRYEDGSGEGLFGLVRTYEDLVETRDVRVNRQRLCKLRTLFKALRDLTPAPPADAYRDRVSRRPVTWFRATARDLLAITEQLVPLLNQLGANIHRIETDRPPPVIWQDAVQVITRRPRRPERPAPNPLKTRRIDRRKRLAKRRQRNGRIKARRLKSSM